MATDSLSTARRVRPLSLTILSFLVIAFLPVAAPPALANRYTDCNGNNTDDDRLIRGCTQIFQRGRKETAKNRTAAYGLRAEAYWRRDERDKAIEDITNAITLNPKSAWSYALPGGYWLDMGRYDEAVGDLTKAISLDPKNSGPRLANRGLAYFKLKKDKEAIADLTQAISAGIVNATIYEFRASAYIGIDDYVKAVGDLDKAIALNPSKIELYYKRGIVRELAIDDMPLFLMSKEEAAKEPDALIADFSEVIRRSEALTRKHNVYRKRAAAYVLKEDNEKAVADFTTALEISPNNAEIYRERAEAYGYAQKYNMAVADYSKVIALEPGKADNYLERGRAYRSAEQYQEALADFTKVIELDPKNTSAYGSRASLYLLDLKDASRAIPDMTKGIELEPDDLYNYKSRAEAYLQLNERDKAAADYIQAIKIASKKIDEMSDFAPSYTTRADLYLDTGNLDGAIADYTKALDISKTDPTLTLEERGNAYLLKGDTAKAIADYARAASLKGDDVTRVFKLAMARFDAGDFKGAAVDLLRVLELKDAPDAMIYRHLARAHAGESSGAELEANMTRLKTKGWPYAAIELMLDRRSPEATLAAATGDDARDCEAPFYIGQWHLLKGNKAEATSMLTAAAAKCGKYEFESRSAKLALKRLGAGGGQATTR